MDRMGHASARVPLVYQTRSRREGRANRGLLSPMTKDALRNSEGDTRGGGPRRGFFEAGRRLKTEQLRPARRPRRVRPTVGRHRLTVRLSVTRGLQRERPTGIEPA